MAGHAEITRAALVEADALLFVLDAESEIGAPEIGSSSRSAPGSAP